MNTRREVLQRMLAAPLLAGLPAPRSANPESYIEIRSDSNLLSEESANGFQWILRSDPTQHGRRIIVLAGMQTISREQTSELQSLARRGAWIIWESACSAPQYVFGRRFLKAVQAAPTSYVQYNWPSKALIRTFGAVTPIACSPTEVIATYKGTPVCAKWTFGRGGIVFLGSMLGPHIQAEDRHAREIGAQLFRI